MTPDYALSPRNKWLCRAMQALAIVTGGFLVIVGFTDNLADKIVTNYWEHLPDAQQAAVIYTPMKKMILKSIATLNWLSPLLILFGIFRIFGTFTTSNPFSLRSVKAIRLLGGLIVAGALASIVTKPAMLLVMTHDSGPGMKVLSIGISTHQTMNLLLGVVLLLVGQFFTMAVDATEENKQFV